MLITEINLLPEEFKKGNKNTASKTNYLVYLIPLFTAIILFLHFFLAVFTILQSSQLNSLNKKWLILQPQKKLLEDLKQKSSLLSADAKIIQELTNQRITWAEKLNKLSLCLPSGIWFNEISFENTTFILRAAVISLEQKDMELINKFLNNLKTDVAFYNKFINLKLDSVEKKVRGGYEISQFIIAGILQ